MHQRRIKVLVVVPYWSPGLFCDGTVMKDAADVPSLMNAHLRSTVGRVPNGLFM
jgi:hypothetical protein